ncbi:MAG: twin-arginine translocase TatA/TatE family subunit [Gammaproteobacteria bacterium]|jgi:sec-independent protein translocase protein TatA|nr:MAG: twin-arginine translocase TatA/TatE family subunit [Gammaproteobacteria bacterium]
MLSGISIWQLLILLLVVALVFGTKKLSTLGSDLGNAIKGFRSAMREEDDSAKKSEKPRTLEGEVESKEGTRQS